MSRVQGFNFRRRPDQPLIERPAEDAPRNERAGYHVLRGSIGFIVLISALFALLVLGALVVNPAAGAVLIVLVLVATLVYKA